MSGKSSFYIKPLFNIKPKGNLNSGQRIVFKSPLFPVFIAIFIAAIYLYSTFYFPPINTARIKFNDYFFRVRLGLNTVFNKEAIKPKDIVLVTVDEESYGRLDKKWPWGRDVFAEFIDKLSGYKPKVVALDFALYGESPGNPEADSKLADAIRRSGNVIVGSVYGKEKIYLGPYEIFAKASAGYGIIGTERDPDGAIRRAKPFALVLTEQKGSDISFEVKAAASYLEVSYSTINMDGRNIIVGNNNKYIKIPTDENHSFLINYLSDDSDIETVPIWRVMLNKVSPDMFKDKLVLVSQTGEIFHDMNWTPLGYRSGGLTIVNELNSIISGACIREAGSNFAIIMLAGVYLLSFVLFYKNTALKGLLGLVSITLLYITVSFLLFLNGFLLPTFDILVLLPLLFLGITFYKYAIVVMEGQEVKKLAITDSLTSLYTHRYFRFLLEHIVKSAASSGGKCSLIIVKLLNLDTIVKEIDFNEGQTVQRKIADNVRVKLPKNGYGAYLGVGEFGMLMPKIGIGEALGIAGSARDNIKETDFGIGDNALKPIVAIGAATINHTAFPRTGTDLMKSARAAMLRAKEIGYNKVCRFNPNIDVSVFEPDIVEKTIKNKFVDEFTFLAIDLEQRNKELEDLLYQLSATQKDLEEAHFETLRSLIVALEEKDPCTAGHSERVGEYAEKIGRKLQISEEELKILRQAAILHDIGKVGIPHDILRKEDILSATERHVIELHPEFSIKILSTSKYFYKHVNAIRDHHERLDGTGYPRGLKGDQISLYAQIIAICDVFDAMSTNRPYRRALSSKEALQEIESHPEKYNQKIARALEETLKSEHKI